MNPWKILGVHRKSTPEEVREAYLELAWRHHPDVGRQPEKFHLAAGAYALLKDKVKLAEFIKQQLAVGKSCEFCKGLGATFKQRGMLGRTYTSCNVCEGSGILQRRKKNEI